MFLSKLALRGFQALTVLILPLCLAQVPSRPIQLSVTGLLSPSISLVFQNNASVGSSGFCPLSNSGTSSVGLDLGSASTHTADPLACIQYSSVANTYTVSTAFDVVVSKTNSGSASYHLAVQLSTVPPGGVNWSINGTNLSTALTTVETTNPYSQAVTQTLAVKVTNSVKAQTLFETITFMATAN